MKAVITAFFLIYSYEAFSEATSIEIVKIERTQRERENWLFSEFYASNGNIDKMREWYLSFRKDGTYYLSEYGFNQQMLKKDDGTYSVDGDKIKFNSRWANVPDYETTFLITTETHDGKCFYVLYIDVDWVCPPNECGARYPLEKKLASECQ